MFDMGFLPDIRKIVKQLPERHQTLLFSATMPADVLGLAREVLNDPATIRIGNDIPASTVSHTLYPVEQHLKTTLLMKLLRQTATDAVLVFTRTKHRTTKVARQMKTAGFPVTSLQGNLSQNQRQTALNGFRNGTYRIMIATDIAARGIDVNSISHVINYDMPDTVEAYTHRIGRTGRADKRGNAFSFITPQERDFAGAIEHILGERIERRTLQDFDYTVPPPAASGAPRRPVSGFERGRPPEQFRRSAPQKQAVSCQMTSRASARRSR
jgi:ATP-dependent RNA helicase RhlE